MHGRGRHRCEFARAEGSPSARSRGHYVFRVVSLRASTTARFSTNYFHNTWHILTDPEGAHVLARLLWGLSFQRKPGTIVLIDREHLVTTPFDADPADPILLGREELTRMDERLIRGLREKIEHAPGQTVRWHTFGLPTWDRPEKIEFSERTKRVAGFVCYFANAMSLRETAHKVWDMRACGEMDYYFLDDCKRYQHASGEVQVFRDFRDMVSAARVARQALHPEAALSPAAREAVQRERVKRSDDRRARRLSRRC